MYNSRAIGSIEFRYRPISIAPSPFRYKIFTNQYTSLIRNNSERRYCQPMIAMGKISAIRLWVCALILWLNSVSAAVLYVDSNGSNPTPPYADWSTAATNIQDAVDLANGGDLILVTNGIYAMGGKRTSDGVTNRVVVTNAVMLQSVNGFPVTVIDGGHAMRCVYLAANAVLSGFTLTNGYVPLSVGGGAYCASGDVLVSNCLMTGNYSEAGGGVYGGVISNCFLIGNIAPYEGGGAAYGTLGNCFLAGNLANHGGGATECALNGCIISNNVAISTNLPLTGPSSFVGGRGGGVYGGTNLQNCIIVSNSAVGRFAVGGGVFGIYFRGMCLTGSQITGNYAVGDGGGYCGLSAAFMTNCLINGNQAGGNGGGVNGDNSSGPTRLVGCIVSGNFATNFGGGTYRVYLYNCTVCENSAGNQGGGAWSGNFDNTIIYYNQAPSYANYYITGGVNWNCCSSPTLSWEGLDWGNITKEPLFINLAAGDFHLQSNSPCINAGLNTYVFTGSDLDDNSRIVAGTVDIGAYEYQSPLSKISYAWLQEYGLPISTNTDITDADGTGMNNWQKWIAGLNPTNPVSQLIMLPGITNGVGGVTVSWQSVSNRTYYLQRASNLAAQPAFFAVQSNIVGQVGTTSFLDASATNAGPYFYRVGVQ